MCTHKGSSTVQSKLRKSTKCIKCYSKEQRKVERPTYE